MSRKHKIGARMRDLLITCDTYGPSTRAELIERLGGSVEHAISSMALRAASQGLLLIDRTRRHAHVYSVAPGWQDRVEGWHSKPAKTSDGIVRHALKTQPNSVFDLGRLCG